MFGQTREYGHGTWTYQGAMGDTQKARLLCSDGKLRLTQRMSLSADTFFSHPCTVQVKHKNVAGYMTMLTGNDLPWGEDEPVAIFQSYTYGKNGFLLPGEVELMCKVKYPEDRGALTYYCQRAKDHTGPHWNYWARKPYTLEWNDDVSNPSS